MNDDFSFDYSITSSELLKNFLVAARPRSQKQRNKALILAHAQTIHYTSN